LKFQTKNSSFKPIFHPRVPFPQKEGKQNGKKRFSGKFFFLLSCLVSLKAQSHSDPGQIFTKPKIFTKLKRSHLPQAEGNKTAKNASRVS
jgi:hypothetical protein